MSIKIIEAHSVEALRQRASTREVQRGGVSLETFEKYTPAQKRAYLARHPDSGYAKKKKTAKRGAKPAAPAAAKPAAPAAKPAAPAADKPVTPPAPKAARPIDEKAPPAPKPERDLEKEHPEWSEETRNRVGNELEKRADQRKAKDADAAQKKHMEKTVYRNPKRKEQYTRYADKYGKNVVKSKATLDKMLNSKDPKIVQLKQILDEADNSKYGLTIRQRKQIDALAKSSPAVAKADKAHSAWLNDKNRAEFYSDELRKFKV